MPLFNLADLFGCLRPEARLIGVDPGRRRIGLALSDVTLMVASPYAQLVRGRMNDNAAEIRALALREGAGALIIGWPLSLDGSEGPAAQSVRDWALALSGATALPATLWDERLSSVAAERLLRGEADLSRRKRLNATDKVAAALILQGALDAHRGGLLSPSEGEELTH